jgi:hypothetical protein
MHLCATRRIGEARSRGATPIERQAGQIDQIDIAQSPAQMPVGLADHQPQQLGKNFSGAVRIGIRQGRVLHQAHPDRTAAPEGSADPCLEPASAASIPQIFAQQFIPLGIVHDRSSNRVQTFATPTRFSRSNSIPPASGEPLPNPISRAAGCASKSKARSARSAARIMRPGVNPITKPEMIVVAIDHRAEQKRVEPGHACEARDRRAERAVGYGRSIGDQRQARRRQR